MATRVGRTVMGRLASVFAGAFFFSAMLMVGVNGLAGALGAFSLRAAFTPVVEFAVATVSGAVAAGFLGRTSKEEAKQADQLDC